MVIGYKGRSKVMEPKKKISLRMKRLYKKVKLNYMNKYVMCD